MTTELEQEFFKVFGIEPKRICYWSNTHCKDCNEDCVNFYIKPEYPEITDRILLELIYIIIRQKGSYHLHIVSDINDLKEQILKSCILLNSFEEFKNVVQSLFREGEE